MSNSQTKHKRQQETQEQITNRSTEHEIETEAIEQIQKSKNIEKQKDKKHKIKHI